MTQTMSVKLESNKKGCESIHSGQFMVSHFEEREEETEFVESDEESDNNKKRVVLPTPSTSTSTQCMQLTKYIPAPSQIYEIDSDLSQVFQTLNVTYK